MDNNSLTRIIRNPNLKRNQTELVSLNNKVRLEKVLGLTVGSGSGLDSNGLLATVAYPAGCVVVLFNVKKNKQSHIVNVSRKTITSLSFSADGKYIATGECGHQPCIRVWEISSGAQVSETTAHKYGINCVAFSPNMKFVVSVGSQHDMMVLVWDWRNNVIVATNKVSSKVKALSFSSSGDFFVTVGNRHVKFWYLDYSNNSSTQAVPLLGRSAILGDKRNNYFCDVSCGVGEMTTTFAITRSGLLCEFNNRRLLDKWVELRTTSANCLSVGHKLICIGCADGIIRCFDPSNLQFICTLPRPHTLGIDIAKGFNRSEFGTALNGGSRYPNTVAITLDETNAKLTCIYNDHSMYVWDIRDLKRVGKSHSFLYHSACIWGVETYPIVKNFAKQLLHPGTFLTCSSDDTVRIWCLDSTNSSIDSSVYKRNIFSQDLFKILYLDPSLKYICDLDVNSGTNEKNGTTFDGKNGVRSIKVSSDGKQLASGDRSGNIRIFDIENQQEICKIEAHDAEVLSLEYSEERNLMASASRDRFIHVFDVNRDYAFVQTLDDHSSSITSIKFIPDQEKGWLTMVSCGADKSIIFRKQNLEDEEISFKRHCHVVGKTTFYDMDISKEKTSVLTACQDRAVRVYNVEDGKNIQFFKGSQGEEGALIKVVLDPSGTYLATSCTDKTLCIYDFATSECVATTSGHSELITGLKFSHNGRNLISVSGDSCIFVWRLPFEIANTIASKLGLPPVPPEKPTNIGKIDKNLFIEERSPTGSPTSGYKFNIKSLPSWAKKQINGAKDIKDDRNSLPHHVQPKGRWAQRMENGSTLIMKSYLSTDAVIPYPNMSNSNNKSESPENLLPKDELARNRHYTDSSSASGSLRQEEEEDIHTTDSSDLVYYPQADIMRGSTFEIRETTEDDLRDKSRHFRRSRSNLSRQGVGKLMPSVSVPNFNELHSDDEDSIIHSNIDESLLSTSKNPLYISTENLDRLDQRERYLKSNFENMDKEIVKESGEKTNRTSISAKYLSKSGTSLSTSLRTPLSVNKTPVSKRREELTKAISEARKKLETLGWRGTGLNSSKSVVNLRELSDLSLRPIRNNDSIRRSISLSDLSITPHKRMVSSTPLQLTEGPRTQAPLWETQSSDFGYSSQSMRKSTSSHDLCRSHSSIVVRSSEMNSIIKSHGLWNSPQFDARKVSNLRKGVNNNHDSSDDESSMSDETYSRTLRPGTPPKPNIFRQIRRSLTSQNVPNSKHLELSSKSKKPWNNFELRSSRSEFNLNFIGQETNNIDKNNCKLVNPTGNLWNNNAGSKNNSLLCNDRNDLMSSNPATVELNAEVCQNIIDELNHIATYAKKIYHRCSSSGNTVLCSMLVDGISKAYVNLSTIVPLPPTNGDLPVISGAHEPTSLVPENMVHTMTLLQQYSDRLLNIVEEKMKK